MHRGIHKTWGGAIGLLRLSRKVSTVDLVLVAGVVGLFFGVAALSREWYGIIRPSVEIDPSPWALPKYTLFSLSRGLIAYALSLGFTLVYGYWAAKDKLAERILVPLLDILQSIPVLGFMPGLVLALITLFPKTNVGLELAAIVMIFTGQAWNMTFSFYHSLKALPNDLGEAATLHRFSGWERLRWVELPFATMGLVWNSMLSMAGGWFFLMVSEAFVLGDKDFRLPGIGSYMSVAVARGNVPAMIWAVVAMVAMIVALDQLLWRPVVVWAQKFRVEEGGPAEASSSWFLNLIRRSRLLRAVRGILRLRRHRKTQALPRLARPPLKPGGSSAAARLISKGFFGILLLALSYGAWKLVHLLAPLPLALWGTILSSGGATLARVLVSTAIGTLWAVPAGLAIGLSPRLSRALQPVVQVLASFPAPMFFPVVIAGLKVAGVGLNVGSVLLMLLGTQWYILFNVVAGAMAIPGDLREAARSYRLGRFQKFRDLYLPAVFPYLVTGWVTAAGGAWNASIVAEYVTFKGEVMTAWGLGAQVSRAAERADFALLAASVVVMSAIVVLFNRLVWQRCYRLAETRFSLSN